MAEFGLIKSFDIDNGELDGFRPEQCFVLGYELAAIDWLLQEHAEEFDRMIHVENMARVQKSLQDSNREGRLAYMHDDVSEGWVQLHVASRHITNQEEPTDG